MRELTTVIIMMMRHIPQTHSLRDALESLKASIEFTAPECMNNRWTEVSDILQTLPNKEDWMKDVIADFMCITRDQINLSDWTPSNNHVTH